MVSQVCYGEITRDPAASSGVHPLDFFLLPSLPHFPFPLTLASLALHSPRNCCYISLYLRFCFLENWDSNTIIDHPLRHRPCKDFYVLTFVVCALVCFSCVLSFHVPLLHNLSENKLLSLTPL